MIDYNLKMLLGKQQTKTILKASFFLSKEDILNTLLSEKILINGKYYLVPEEELIFHLTKKQFGKITLELELIKN